MAKDGWNYKRTLVARCSGEAPDHDYRQPVKGAVPTPKVERTTRKGNAGARGAEGARPQRPGFGRAAIRVKWLGTVGTLRFVGRY